MNAPKLTDRLVKVKAYLTDEDFGNDHWQARQFLAPRDSQFALLQIFDSEAERNAAHDRLLAASRVPDPPTTKGETDEEGCRHGDLFEVMAALDESMGCLTLPGGGPVCCFWQPHPVTPCEDCRRVASRILRRFDAIRAEVAVSRVSDPPTKNDQDAVSRVDGERDAPTTRSTAKIATSDAPRLDDEIVAFLAAYYGTPDRATLLRVWPERTFDEVALIRSWESVVPK